MKSLAKGIVKLRYIIVIASLALMIPCFIGMAATRVNYDIVTYLPGDIETMKGQDILAKDFGTGAFCMLAGLVIVPAVSMLFKAPDRDEVDSIFSCYDEKVTVEKRYSLPENAPADEA